MKILDVGAGPSSERSHQIDIVKYLNTTHVLDAMMEPWPFKNLHFDEVCMEQFLEHCPPVVKYFDGSWKTHYPIVHCMKEPIGYLYMEVSCIVLFHLRPKLTLKIPLILARSGQKAASTTSVVNGEGEKKDHLHMCHTA